MYLVSSGHRALLLAVTLGTGTWMQSAAAATLEFQTGSFDVAEWFTLALPGLSGSATSTTESVGGNSGAYRQISLTLDPFESALEASLWENANFSPAALGEIVSVSMSYDITRISSSMSSATQVAKGVAIVQDGVLYRSFLGVSTASPPTWESAAVGNLVPLFPNVDWRSGSEISFGFFNSAGASVDGFTIAGGYDNFRLVIDYVPRAVPLPLSLPLLAGGLGLLLPTARRRQAVPGR